MMLLFIPECSSLLISMITDEDPLVPLTLGFRDFSMLQVPGLVLVTNPWIF